MTTYQELVSPRARKTRKIVCVACGKEFIAREHRRGGPRRYCYDPHCEVNREREKRRKARQQREKKLEQGAKQ